MTKTFRIITAVLHLEKNNLTKLDSNSFRGMRFMRRLYFNDNQIRSVRNTYLYIVYLYLYLYFLFFNENQIRSVRNTFVYSIFVFAFPLLQWQPDHIISYHRHIISYDIISSCLIKVGRQTFQAMGRIGGIHLRGNRSNIAVIPHPCHCNAFINCIVSHWWLKAALNDWRYSPEREQVKHYYHSTIHILFIDEASLNDWRDSPEREQVKHFRHSTIHILVIDEDSFIWLEGFIGTGLRARHLHLL